MKQSEPIINKTDELSSQDVEHRINSWKLNVENIRKSYFNEASQLSTFETHLDQAQTQLYNWIANVKLMQEKQNLLESELNFINERQQELINEINSIHLFADEEPTSVSISSSVDDLQQRLANLNVDKEKLRSPSRPENVEEDLKIVVAKTLNAQLSCLQILTQRIVKIRSEMNNCGEPDEDDEESIYQ